MRDLGKLRGKKFSFQAMKLLEHSDGKKTKEVTMQRALKPDNCKWRKIITGGGKSSSTFFGGKFYVIYFFCLFFVRFLFVLKNGYESAAFVFWLSPAWR